MKGTWTKLRAIAGLGDEYILSLHSQTPFLKLVPSTSGQGNTQVEELYFPKKATMLAHLPTCIVFSLYKMINCTFTHLKKICVFLNHICMTIYTLVA